jgi:hypothetical protein
MNIAVNFEYQLISIIDNIVASTHEYQVMGDVMEFTKTVRMQVPSNDVYNFNYNYYKLFNKMVLKATLKQYFNVLGMLHNSELHSYDSAFRFPTHEVFMIGCNHNLLDIVEWAFMRFPRVPGFHPIKEIALNYLSNPGFTPFNIVCAAGYLDIAKFLFGEMLKFWESSPDVIEKHALIAFEHACENGRSHIVEWLLLLNPNLANIIYNMKIVNTICTNHYIDIIDILTQIRPYKLDIVFNEDRTQVISYKINSPEEEKWLQRKLPLLAHYFQDEYNSFKYVPNEIVRHICEFV